MVGGGRGRDEEAVVAVSQGRSALAGVGGLAPGDEKEREQRKTNDWATTAAMSQTGREDEFDRCDGQEEIRNAIEQGKVLDSVNRSIEESYREEKSDNRIQETGQNTGESTEVQNPGEHTETHK